MATRRCFVCNCFWKTALCFNSLVFLPDSSLTWTCSCLVFFFFHDQITSSPRQDQLSQATMVPFTIKKNCILWVWDNDTHGTWKELTVPCICFGDCQHRFQTPCDSPSVPVVLVCPLKTSASLSSLVSFYDKTPAAFGRIPVPQDPSSTTSWGSSDEKSLWSMMLRTKTVQVPSIARGLTSLLSLLRCLPQQARTTVSFRSLFLGASVASTTRRSQFLCAMIRSAS